MRVLVLICLALALSIAFSGCLDMDFGEGEDLSDDEEDETPQWATRSWEATFTGTVPVGAPGHMDETSTGCEELTGGEEDVTYSWATFDVNTTPSQAEIVLDWDAQDAGGMWNFPDLELRLVDPDGGFIDECEGVSASSPETLSLVLDKQGAYKAQIVNYAGVAVDYELNVKLTYQVLVEEEKDTDGEEDGDEADEADEGDA